MTTGTSGSKRDSDINNKMPKWFSFEGGIDCVECGVYVNKVCKTAHEGEWLCRECYKLQQEDEVEVKTKPKRSMKEITKETIFTNGGSLRFGVVSIFKDGRVKVRLTEMVFQKQDFPDLHVEPDEDEEMNIILTFHPHTTKAQEKANPGCDGFWKRKGITYYPVIN